MTRLFFATDIHGSDVCWKKFLNAGKFYRADVLVLGGDMTGKALVPIVRQQDGFLTHGIAHLKPMTLKMVAETIDMHESTVSRVTANKYMATPRGLYEMKYFFTTAIASSDGGGDHSAEAVRHRIKQLIDAETASNVLSDDTIVEILRKAGIDIARRTVAKYRDALRIPSSVQRRRDKQATAP